MSEEFDVDAESDLRKRAAWLLGMLVLVAALVVTIMVTVLGGSGNDDDNTTVADPSIGATGPGPTSGSSATSAVRTPGSPSPGSPSPGSTGASTGASGASTPSSASGTTSCPGRSTCILKGDAGNAAAAINIYRTKNGQKAVPVAVGPVAQQCALNNGSGCDGGWAETQLASHDGAMAVQKIEQFGKLLDPGVKSIDIGWAYDPGAKQFYFAIIRND